MRLFVNSCHGCGERIYLNVSASSRSAFRTSIGGYDLFHLTCNHCGFKSVYRVSEVFAEADSRATATGGIVGGLIGLIGGPAGLLIGGGLGAAIGSQTDIEEKRKAAFFNSSV
ncbi:MAG: hypothetical protein KDD36_09595 [Flavobacteriales bacterium]|nr:hypothetical protein [Flavobacteriales bacterium]